MENLVPHFIELIRRASTDLPADIEAALHKARDGEEPGSAAQTSFRLDPRKRAPLACRLDAHLPGHRHPDLLRLLSDRLVDPGAEEANPRGRGDGDSEVVSPARTRSTRLTGKNPGNNLGDDFPYFHFEEWEEPYLRVDLMLKGGGCENVGAQYSLPDSRLEAGRDLEGVRRAVLDAVHQAQGMGCAPAVIGVAVGGDRGSSYIKSKEQFYRPLDDVNADPKLAELEQRLTREANTLGIGPMGFGGKTTVLSVKIDSLERLPASYFVTASYMCWADRRRTLIYRDGQVTIE